MKVKHVSVFASLTLALQGPAFAGAPVTASQPAPVPTTAPGDDWCAQWGLGIQAGTQGAGLHLRYDLNPSLYFKLEGNYMGWKDEIEVDDITYKGDLDFGNIGLTANYLPFAGYGFRLTAGAFFGKNEFDGESTSTGTLELNGTTYPITSADKLMGTVEYDTFNPYLGIGWDWALGEKKNFIIGLDAGVSYLGEPTTTLTATGTLATIPGITADLDAERIAFQDDLEDFQFYPVLKLSFTYRF